MKPETMCNNLSAAWTVLIEERATQAQQARFFERALAEVSVYFAQDTEKPRTRAISLEPVQQPSPPSVVVYQEPHFTLDPLR
jgi:hypothetical protein